MLPIHWEIAQEPPSVLEPFLGQRTYLAMLTRYPMLSQLVPDILAYAMKAQ